MKKFYIILIIFISVIFTGCKGDSNEVVITGHLEGVEDGVVLSLMKPDGKVSTVFQTDTIKGGEFRFSFTDKVNIPKIMSIISDAEGFPPVWLEVWVLPGADIRITGKDKLIGTWDVASNIQEQEEANKYNTLIYEHERHFEKIMCDIYSCYKKMNETSSVDKINDLMSEIMSLRAITDTLNIYIAEAEIDFMEQNKTYSPVWITKLEKCVNSLKYTNVADVYVEKVKKMYADLSDELKNSETGQSIYINLFPPEVVEIGDDMADADMWDIEGNLRHLADYKGKYLLLDFWSATSDPCINAMPEMREISEKYKGRLEVISISSDPKNVWEAVSKEKNVTWVNLNDFKGDNGIKLRYGVFGIPHYVMISPEGKVFTSWSGYGEGSLKMKMEELVK